MIRCCARLSNYFGLKRLMLGTRIDAEKFASRPRDAMVKR